MENKLADIQPWLPKSINICQKGISGPKQDTNTELLKQKFLSHMHEHTTSNHIYTDGSKSQNGVGFGVVYGVNLENHIRGTLPTEATIFTAELQAIKAALSMIESSNKQKWTIFSDSQAFSFLLCPMGHRFTVPLREPSSKVPARLPPPQGSSRANPDPGL